MYLIHRQTIKEFIIIGRLKVALFCYKQLPFNTKQKCEFPYHLIVEKRLLSTVIRVTMLSDDKPFDFHDKIFSVPVSFLKYNKAVEILSNFVLHH